MAASTLDVNIAVDAMGGDFAPDVNVQGALLALGEAEGFAITLVGDRTTLLRELKKRGAKEGTRLVVVHAEERITMDDHAAQAVRKKKNSSIHVGLRLLKDGFVHGFVSAGNSGAVMACSLAILGRLADVERPAIVVKLPTADGFIILLDAGANVDCKAAHLAQFAEMGHVYAEVIEGIPTPRIGLLSNASESHKGNEITRETHQLLGERANLRYIGYVEGFDLFSGRTDVAVCDGFVGNVILKTMEGLADALFHWFRKEIQRDVLGMTGALLMRRVLRRFKGKFDYQPYGAAPLLGINGMVMISHGGSTELAIRNGILTARRGIDQGFVKKIAARLAGGSRGGEAGESS